MKHNQKGFGAIGIVIVILIVAVLGSVGVLVYNNQNKKADSTPKHDPGYVSGNQAPSSFEGNSDTGYLDIFTWKVKMKVEAELGTVTASQDGYKRDTQINFSSTLEDSIPEVCQLRRPVDKYYTFEGIARTSENDADYPKKVGKYYYQRVYPKETSEACQNNKAAYDLASKVDGLYQKMYSTLEATN